MRSPVGLWTSEDIQSSPNSCSCGSWSYKVPGSRRFSSRLIVFLHTNGCPQKHPSGMLPRMVTYTPRTRPGFLPNSPVKYCSVWNLILSSDYLSYEPAFTFSVAFYSHSSFLHLVDLSNTSLENFTHSATATGVYRASRRTRWQSSVRGCQYKYSGSPTLAWDNQSAKSLVTKMESIFQTPFEVSKISYRPDIPIKTPEQKAALGLPNNTLISKLKGNQLDRTRKRIRGLHSPYAYESARGSAQKSIVFLLCQRSCRLSF